MSDHQTNVANDEEMVQDAPVATSQPADATPVADAPQMANPASPADGDSAPESAPEASTPAEPVAEATPEAVSEPASAEMGGSSSDETPAEPIAGQAVETDGIPETAVAADSATQAPHDHDTAPADSADADSGATTIETTPSDTVSEDSAVATSNADSGVTGILEPASAETGYQENAPTATMSEATSSEAVAVTEATPALSTSAGEPTPATTGEGEASAVTATSAASAEMTAEGAPAAAEATTAPSEGSETATAIETAPAAPPAEGQRPRRERDRDRDRNRGRRGGGGRQGRKLDSFSPGEELQGTVRSLQTYGAFVDVGAERDGLVHISELRDGYVEKVDDVVKEGDTVQVRVKEVDVEKGRLSLTMRAPRPAGEQREPRAPRPPRAEGEQRPPREGGEARAPREGGEQRAPRPPREGEAPRGAIPAAGTASEPREGREQREGRDRGDSRERESREQREQREGREREQRERRRREEEEGPKKTRLRDLAEGQEYPGRVTSIVDYGAFVDIGAVTDGLVHISEISDDRISSVNSVLQEGQEVTVRILTIDRKRNRISLSMKPASDEAEAYEGAGDVQTFEDEGNGEMPSMMELAFRRAQEESGRKKDRGDRKAKRELDDNMDDIINRTLNMRD